MATEPRLKWHVPDDRQYDTHHQWAKPQETLWVIGISDYTQDTAGDILYLSLPEPGTRLEKGRPFGSLESGKWVGQLYAPFDGTVIAANPAVLEQPALLNTDPYERGWLIMALPDTAGEWDGLSPDAYRQWLWTLEETP